MLFEAGPANGWLIGPWARSAPHPRGGSLGTEVYKRLPNDTDYTLLARHDIPGLNFALVGDGYAYHTARDVPNVSEPKPFGRREKMSWRVALALDRDRHHAANDAGRDILRYRGVAAVGYSTVVEWVVTTASLLSWRDRIGSNDHGGNTSRRCRALDLYGGLDRRRRGRRDGPDDRRDRGASRRAGGLPPVVRVPGSFVPAPARGRHHDRVGDDPAGGVAAGAVAWTSSPVTTWSLALPVWLAFAIGAVWLAPAASYSVDAAATRSVRASSRQSASECDRYQSRISGRPAVSGTLWLQNTTEILRFMTAVLGRLPIVTPVYVYAAIMSVAGLMIVPPLVAIVAGHRPLPRPSLVTALCLLAIALAAGFAAWAPAYTFERPLRRHVRALQEAGAAPPPGKSHRLSPASISHREPRRDGVFSPRQPAASVPWGRLLTPSSSAPTAPRSGPAPVDIAALHRGPRAGGRRAGAHRCAAAAAGWRCRSSFRPELRLRARACPARHGSGGGRRHSSRRRRTASPGAPASLASTPAGCSDVGCRDYRFRVPGRRGLAAAARLASR